MIVRPVNQKLTLVRSAVLEKSPVPGRKREDFGAFLSPSPFMRVFLQVVSCLILYAESFAQFFSSSSGSHSPSVFIPWHMADGELSKSISGYFAFGDWKAALYCNNREDTVIDP